MNVKLNIRLIEHLAFEISPKKTPFITNEGMNHAK